MRINKCFFNTFFMKRLLKQIGEIDWKKGAVTVAAMAIVGWIYKQYVDSSKTEDIHDA